MYRVCVRKRFSAAHRLLEYDGNCERLHGHNWLVEVTCEGETPDKLGMLIDFRVLKKSLGCIIEELDHNFLNDLPQFKKINPSSEYIARYIFDQMSADIKSPASISEVKVWESEDSWAAYSTPKNGKTAPKRTPKKTPRK